MATTDLGKTSMGMEANVAGLLSYVLGLITGLIFFLLEKENKFVKFHAFQSIAVSIAWVVLSIVVNMVLAFIPAIGLLGSMVISLGGLALWIVCMVKAYQGEVFRLPVVGDMAAKQAGL